MKRTYWFTIISMLLLLFLGCATTKKAPPLVYQAPGPEEELCTLEIHKDLTVKEFDGVKVSWSRGWLTDTFVGGDVMVKIPAGVHDFSVDYYRIVENGPNIERTWFTDLVAEGTLLPGRTYRMEPKKEKRTFVIQITDITQE